MAPPLPPAGNVIELLLQWSDQQDMNVLNRLFFAYEGSTPTAAQLHTWLVSLVTPWNANVVDLYTSGVELLTTTATDLSVESGNRGTSTWDINGTRAGVGAPLGAPVLVNYQLTRRYRGGKPRNYLPLGDVSDLNDPGHWTTAFQAAVSGGWGAFLGAVVGSTVGGATITNHVNISYYSSFTNVPYGSPTKYRRVPTPRATPLVDLISTYSVSLIPGSQRRRYKRSA